MNTKTNTTMEDEFHGVTGVSNLVKMLGQNLVLKGLSVKISFGEFVAILGPSGCGKTTLLRCISGLETPTEGKIWINGALVFGEGVNVPTRQREIGMVFQSYACWPHMTVYENVALPLKIRKVDSSTTRSHVEKTLRLVGLPDLSHRYPGQLSGGQQQRVSLARSLSYNPKLLLLDEPLSNLDANLRIELRREIRRIQRETKVTTLYVTHDKDEAFALADRLLIMRDGFIIEEGTPDQLRRAPRTEYAATFLDAGFVLYGKLTESRGDRTIVKVADYYIETKNSSTKSIGTDVRLFLPRESVQINKPEGQKNTTRSLSGKNSMLGEVIEIEHEGDKIEVRIEVASQTLVLLINEETAWSSLGEKVIISVNPDLVRIVEAIK